MELLTEFVGCLQCVDLPAMLSDHLANLFLMLLRQALGRLLLPARPLLLDALLKAPATTVSSY